MDVWIILVYIPVVLLHRYEATTVSTDVILSHDERESFGNNSELGTISMVHGITEKLTSIGFDKLHSTVNESETVKSSTVDGKIYAEVKTKFEQLQDWNRLCNITFNPKDSIKLLCTVPKGMKLKFSSFRNFTSQLLQRIEFDVEVKCTGGQLHFPWPFRAEKLSRIYIYNCTIKDYLTEYKEANINNITDTIKFLHVEFSTVVIRIAELFNSFSKNNSPKVRAAECGPENAVEIIRRNLTIKYEDLENLKNYDTGLIDIHTHYLNIQKRTCLYKNLAVFEISGTSSLEKHTLNKIVYTDDSPRLRVLNFTRCGVHDSLYKFQGWRLRFLNMEYLDFSHNKIQIVPSIRDYGRFKTFLSKNNSIGVIDLTYNNITTITKDMINSFAKHKTVKVDIRNNPFRCDCGIIGIYRYMRTKTLPAIYDYLESLTCTWPKSVEGKLMSTLSLDDLHCTRENVVNIPAIIFSIIILILFTCTVTLIYFRNPIKVVLYTRMNITIPCKNKCEKNAGKNYDAFVAYSEKDADWVLQSVLPKLENMNKSFKLCLHHRDFVVGVTIADNIIQSVENSLHTILIMSNSFLQSEWCMMEFRTALHKSLKDKRRLLIIVLKDDLILDEIDSDLKNFVLNYTCLKYKDILFWDKLMYAITYRS